MGTGSKYVPDQPPKSPKANLALGAVKGALAAVPVAGGFAAELVEKLVAPAVNARRDEWLEDIATELHDLIEKVEDLTQEELADDPSFITTFMSASQIAMRSHQEEKREALRNAVLNTALPNAPDDDLQAIFLNRVDRYTPWHLRILKLFDDPIGVTAAKNIDYSNVITSSVSQLIEDVFPELKGQNDFYNLIGTDFSLAGLAGTSSFNTMITKGGLLQRRTSQLGRTFLEFISRPVT